MADLSMAMCANPACARLVPRRSTTGLCGGCEKHWERYGVPAAGFISSLELTRIAADFMREVSPTEAEVAAALRIMRGPRYREGPWRDRPAYRLQPLLRGRWNQRLPHLLVGRRKAPALQSIGKALTHYHLARTVIGTRGTYPQFLAGATFYGRRAPIAPKGEDALTGGAKSAGYRLHITDFSAIGREVLKAAKAPRFAGWTSHPPYMDPRQQSPVELLEMRPPSVLPVGGVIIVGNARGPTEKENEDATIQQMPPPVDLVACWHRGNAVACGMRYPGSGQFAFGSHRF